MQRPASEAAAPPSWLLIKLMRNLDILWHPVYVFRRPRLSRFHAKRRTSAVSGYSPSYQLGLRGRCGILPLSRWRGFELIVPISHLLHIHQYQWSLIK